MGRRRCAVSQEQQHAAYEQSLQYYITRKQQVHDNIVALQQRRLERLLPGPQLPPLWQPTLLERPMTFYKLVAAVDGRLVSVFDRRVQYALGRWTHARYGSSGDGWPPLWSCLHAFASREQALQAPFPRDSDLPQGARVLVRVTGIGKAYCNVGHASSSGDAASSDGDGGSAGGGHWALSRLRVEALLDDVPEGPAELFLDWARAGTALV